MQADSGIPSSRATSTGKPGTSPFHSREFGKARPVSSSIPRPTPLACARRDVSMLRTEPPGSGSTLPRLLSMMRLKAHLTVSSSAAAVIYLATSQPMYIAASAIAARPGGLGRVDQADFSRVFLGECTHCAHTLQKRAK